MPYIKEERRQIFDKHIDALNPENAGDLNYIMTKLCLGLMQKSIKADGRLTYNNLNSIIGALESCKLEFYRRQVSCHENKVQEANGDVGFTFTRFD